MQYDPSREVVSAEDKEVMAQSAEWLRAGRQVALTMVTHTWGSSPRPPGSLMAMNDMGRFVGSVSGGCVESELVERYRGGELIGSLPASVGFGIDSQEAGRLGLPCGGRLQLSIEPLGSVDMIDQLLDRLDQGELVARRLCLKTGEVSLHAGEDYPELTVSQEMVTKVFGPSWHLLLVGDGQLARYLASMARMLDYQVTICDPREAFADPFPLPDVNYIRQMPDDAVRELASQPRTAVVTLAHDPKQDDLALMAALESDVFYIGALGSTRSASSRLERLQGLGFTTQQTARLHGPAGLSIGSKRPSEIALSILAEVTAMRNDMTRLVKTVAEES